MYKKLIIVPVMALILSACVVSPNHNRGVVVAPALPVVVELGADPYYYHSGYYYYYSNDNWRYSNARSGPWTNLPRSHYPRETRFKGHSDNRGKYKGRDYDNRGRDNGRGHDNRDYDNRGRDYDRDNRNHR